MVTIPPHLAENLRAWHGAEGEAWVAGLPALVAAVAERWGVEIGEPFADGGAVSWVAPAVTADGGDAVVKLFLVGLENAEEPAALRHYDGRGAVRMLAGEPGALLLERLSPGTPLWEVEDDDEACLAVAGLLRELWRSPAPGHPFRSLADDAAGWAETIGRLWEQLGRPFERSLVDEATAAVADLAPSQGGQVVLHQDLHGGNVLRAGRAPWLAIDPKPVVGEREFDLASLIRDRRWAIGERIVRRRLDLLSSELGLDRERMRRWALLHALAWGVDETGAWPEMVACARWLRDC
ncbi:MAG TPA: aminoglycoside phosphotransferase family protein [Gaiellales bacterium]|nr:aminoglycoside phosphotransferase family protein [Gaiellales bacterium]